MAGPSQLFDSHRERWPLVLPSWLTCVMLPGWYLARWLLIWIFATPSDMGDAYSLCSNVEVLFHHVHFCFLWFCFVCVQVRILLFLPVTPTRAISRRSRLVRAVFPTGTCRCRSIEEAHSLLGQREYAYHERHRFRKNSDISIEASFELRLL
jgi:hypothetical protein